MRKLIFNLLLFSILIIFLISYILLKAPINENHYLLSIKDKSQLLKKTKSPRIIFSGGSNLAFGIDSEQIQNHFHKNTINLGVHAGFRINFILNFLKENIKEGDILIFNLEYSNFNKNKAYGETSLFRTLVYDKSIYKYLTFKNYIEFIRYLPSLLQIRFKEFIIGEKLNKLIEKKSNYQRNYFNKFGDYIIPENLEPKKDLIGLIDLSQNVKKEPIELINNFYKNYALKKHCKCYLIFPAISNNKIKNLENLSSITKAIKNNLKIKVLGNGFDGIYDKSLFFDTVYHLNKKGKKINTERIIKLLDKELLK